MVFKKGEKMKMFLQGGLLYSIAFCLSLGFVNCAKQGEVREPQSQSLEIQDYAKCFKGELCGVNETMECYSPDIYFVLPEDKEIICFKQESDLEVIEQ